MPCGRILTFNSATTVFLCYRMNLITPEVRSQIEAMTRRAGHIWRYL
jgi:hypothetical protein